LVLSVAADGSVGRHQVGAIAAALRPRRGGGAVIGVPAVAVAGAVAVMLAYPLTESAVRSLVASWPPDAGRRFFETGRPMWAG
jgi:hypothetical protein